MSNLTLENITLALSNSPEILGKDKYFNSAVLVPLVIIEDKFHFLFEKRANHIRQGGEVANFLFEAGMLKRTPRSGFQFLGCGAESVAEHIFRTTYVGFALGKMEQNVDVDKLIKMCLFHDLQKQGQVT